MTDKLEQAQEAVEASREVVAETTQTLLEAMDTVERSLEETRKLLMGAIHKARDAETVTKLLKARIQALTKQISQK